MLLGGGFVSKGRLDLGWWERRGGVGRRGHRDPHAAADTQKETILRIEKVFRFEQYAELVLILGMKDSG